MALRQIRIGAVDNAAQYDDSDYDSAMETDQPIRAGTPINGNDVLRLDDIGGIVGNVVGPASAVDNNVVIFNGITGKIIKDSGVAIVNIILTILARYVYNEVVVPPTATSLTIGTELSSLMIETVRISAAGAEILTNFLNGTEGQIKILIFNGSNVSLTDGTRDSGKFYLNQLPALTNFNGSTGDILTLINISGDGGTTTHGWWEELFRVNKVK